MWGIRYLERVGAQVIIIPKSAIERRPVTAQQLPERASEVLMERYVYDWIQHRVRVAQPQRETFDGGPGIVLYERLEQGQNEERQPTDRERTHDYAQSD